MSCHLEQPENERWSQDVYKRSNINVYKYSQITYIQTDNMDSDKRIKQDMTQNIRQEHNGKGALALVLHCFWFVQYFSGRQVQEAE